MKIVDLDERYESLYCACAKKREYLESRDIVKKGAYVR